MRPGRELVAAQETTLARRGGNGGLCEGGKIELGPEGGVGQRGGGAEEP